MSIVIGPSERARRDRFLYGGFGCAFIMVSREEGLMKILLWIVSAVMVLAAAMLIADVGAAALWFAVIAVGIAVVVIVQTRAHHGLQP